MATRILVQIRYVGIAKDQAGLEVIEVEERDVAVQSRTERLSDLGAGNARFLASDDS